MIRIILHFWSQWSWLWQLINPLCYACCKTIIGSVDNLFQNRKNASVKLYISGCIHIRLLIILIAILVHFFLCTFIKYSPTSLCLLKLSFLLRPDKTPHMKPSSIFSLFVYLFSLWVSSYLFLLYFNSLY